MSGRPKKKPEYNAEKQFDAFLQELSAAYEEADSMRGLAEELNITLLKLRKLLITAGVFSSDVCTEVNELRKQGKSVPEKKLLMLMMWSYAISLSDDFSFG